MVEDSVFPELVGERAQQLLLLANRRHGADPPTLQGLPSPLLRNRATIGFLCARACTQCCSADWWQCRLPPPPRSIATLAITTRATIAGGTNNNNHQSHRPQQAHIQQRTQTSVSTPLTTSATHTHTTRHGDSVASNNTDLKGGRDDDNEDSETTWQAQRLAPSVPAGLHELFRSASGTDAEQRKEPMTIDVDMVGLSLLPRQATRPR